MLPCRHICITSQWATGIITTTEWDGEVSVLEIGCAGVDAAQTQPTKSDM